MKLTQKLNLLFTIPLFFLFLNCSVKQNSKTCVHGTTSIIPPVASFVKILIHNEAGKIKSTGSGIIVKQTKKYTIVLTAKHLCVKDMSIGAEFTNVSVLDYHEIKYSSIVVKVDEKNDLCLIATIATKINARAVAIAKTKPGIGSRVYNLAAPLGIFNEEMVLIFEGFYSGDRTKEVTHSVYTFPGAGGSSGSAVFNEDFEVLGIVSLGVVRFNNLMIAVDYNSVYNFTSNFSDIEILAREQIRLKNLASIDEMLRFLDSK